MLDELTSGVNEEKSHKTNKDEVFNRCIMNSRRELHTRRMLSIWKSYSVPVDNNKSERPLWEFELPEKELSTSNIWTFGSIILKGHKAVR